MKPEDIDAEWSPTDDADLIQQRRELDAAFEHAVRRQRAYDYMSRVAARGNRLVARLLLGSVLFFAWAVCLALLVGAA